METHTRLRLTMATSKLYIPPGLRGVPSWLGMRPALMSQGYRGLGGTHHSRSYQTFQDCQKGEGSLDRAGDKQGLWTCLDPLPSVGNGQGK